MISALYDSTCKVTSIGIAVTKCEVNENVTVLIAAADKGLYQAKNAGRDRVVLNN